MTSSRAAALILALSLAAALAGCPQDIRGRSDGGHGGGDGASDGGGGGGDGGGGWDGNGGGDGGGGGDGAGWDAGAPDGPPFQGGDGGAGPAVTCNRVGTGEVIAGQAAEFDCTADNPTSRPLEWNFSADPSYATFVDGLGPQGKLFVTYRPENLPKDFPTTVAKISIGAAFTDVHSQFTITTTNLPVTGNLLVADKDGTVTAFSSDGTSRGGFTGGLRVQKPTLVKELKNGTVVVGCVAATGIDALQLYDRHAVYQKSFSKVDTTGATIFPDGAWPFDATEDKAGNVWVSVVNPAVSGDQTLYQFDSSGLLATLVPFPPDLKTSWQGSWEPLGIATLADGTVLVANGYFSYHAMVAVYPAGATAGSHHIKLPVQRCKNDTGSVVCSGTVDDFAPGAGGLMAKGDGLLYVTMPDNYSAEVATFTDPDLTFVNATIKNNSDSVIGSARLGWMDMQGGVLAIGQTDYGCTLAIDPKTLGPITNWRDPNGCFTVGGGYNLKGLTHLFAP